MHKLSKWEVIFAASARFWMDTNTRIDTIRF